MMETSAKISDKQIFVNDYISSNEYKLNDGTSRSYIANEKSYVEFMLENISSDLWNVILNTEDYAKISEFAEKNGIQDDLESFLDELYYADVITYGDVEEIYDDVLFQNSKMDLNPDIDELNKYNNEKKFFLFKNNFLYELHIQLDNNLNSIDLYKNLIDDAKKIGLNKLCLSMDNTNINDLFFSIAEYARKKKISLELYIQPQSINYNDKTKFNNTLEKIIDLYPHRIIMPLYSADKSIQDSITGIEGSFGVTDFMLYRFLEVYIPVNINYIQTEKNRGCFEDVLEYTKEKGVEISCYDENILNDNRGKLLNLVNDGNLNIDSSEIDKNIFYGKQQLFVSPDFNIYNSLGYKFGNLNEESLIKIWNEKLAKGDLK